jgi:oligopeptide/dipeptide ABC transporter ATP-binding protein
MLDNHDESFDDRLLPPLLELQDLHVRFSSLAGRVQAVRGVSLRVEMGETLGLVGETGCGKSVTAAALMGLIACPPGRVAARELRFRGRNLLGPVDRQLISHHSEGHRPLFGEALESVRGHSMTMVFQDPSAALNPTFPVGDMLMAVLRHHHPDLEEVEREERAIEWLEMVGLPRPSELLACYPHQLSGGMKQRIAIALALAPHPLLLLADEPTTALDVTVQAQVLALLRGMQKATGFGMIMITHDLGVVAETCHRVAVMYAGRVVEEAPVQALFDEPAHPYTRGLFRARPALGVSKEQRLEAIPGAVPPATRLPSGCAFHPRCPRAAERCRTQTPVLTPVHTGDPSHRSACFYPLAGSPPGPEDQP